MLYQDCAEYECSISGYKRRKLRDLSLEEKIDIVEDVLVKKDYHENICSRYNINRESIKSLFKAIKKDSKYLSKLRSKESTKLKQEHLILESV